MKQPESKYILLVPEQLPQFIGDWKLGEIRAVLMFSLQWLDSLPLMMQGGEYGETKNNSEQEAAA